MLYSVYGLWLSANLPIPRLQASIAELAPDVQVWLDTTPPWLGKMLEAEQQIYYVSKYQDERGEPALTVWKLADGAHFRLFYSDGIEFIVDRSGSRIWASCSETLTREDTTIYLLGPVLGFLLRLRGVTCLHASAVVVGDQAIALLGPAGAGKSTTAACFTRLGYSVLSDDVVPLLENDKSFLVPSAYPYLWLWPDSVSSLFGSADMLPRLIPTWDKRYLDLMENGNQFQQEPLALAAIYILGERCTDSDAPFVEAVPARAGLVALVANTYASSMLDKCMRAQEFESLCQVVARVPLRRVTPHADPAYLSRLCEVILSDFQALTPIRKKIEGPNLGTRIHHWPSGEEGLRS